MVTILSTYMALTKLKVSLVATSYVPLIMSKLRLTRACYLPISSKAGVEKVYVRYSNNLSVFPYFNPKILFVKLILPFSFMLIRDVNYNFV